MGYNGPSTFSLLNSKCHHKNLEESAKYKATAELPLLTEEDVAKLAARRLKPFRLALRQFLLAFAGNKSLCTWEDRAFHNYVFKATNKTVDNLTYSALLVMCMVGVFLPSRLM